jgi:aspartate-semialdehyde dehydrogenase
MNDVAAPENPGTTDIGGKSMASGCKVAIVGATGEVGRALLAALEEAELPLAEVHALASAGSTEETVMFKGRGLLVSALDEFDFARADIAIFAVPADVASEYVPRARSAGCRVIDHSTAYRLDAAVPLVADGMPVPSADLVACPSALAALLLPVLKSVSGIRAVNVTVLEPVSVAGRAGVRELAGQTGELLNGRGVEAAAFPVQIAFNALPVPGPESAEALMDELERLLDLSVPVVLSAVRVPVFYGLTVAVTLETEADEDLGRWRQRLAKAGLHFENGEEDQELVTPVTQAAREAGLYVADLQPLPAPLRGLRLWLVGDNLRQGVARQSLHVLGNWIKDFKY